jgi:hypothetical protein
MNYEVLEGITSEDLTMHIFPMGMIPGNTNGIEVRLPFIKHKKVNLTAVEYNFP